MTTWLETLETLPTLSSAIHLTVVVPSAATSTLPLAALNVVAVPLVVGSVPSVVTLIRLTPAPPSVAAIATVTGEAPYQPAVHAARVALSAELVGAVPSACAVKLVPVPVLPAVSCAVTEPLRVTGCP